MLESSLIQTIVATGLSRAQKRVFLSEERCNL